MKWAAMQEQIAKAPPPKLVKERPDINPFPPPPKSRLHPERETAKACEAPVPRGTNEPVRTPQISQADQDEGMAELRQWAREASAILGPRITGRVPDGFVGPPMSGPMRLSRLA